jgi:hypothetical protein
MTETQPQPISLSETELKEIKLKATETKRLLEYAFHNASAEQLSELEPSLTDIRVQLKLCELISAVRTGLKKSRSLGTWLPRGNIEQIVRACSNQRYEALAIESILNKHGGINGLLVFHLGVKDQTTLFTTVDALPTEMKEDLAKQCGKEKINMYVAQWISSYDTSKSTIVFLAPQQTFYD